MSTDRDNAACVVAHGCYKMRIALKGWRKLRGRLGWRAASMRHSGSQLTCLGNMTLAADNTQPASVATAGTRSRWKSEGCSLIWPASNHTSIATNDGWAFDGFRSP